MRNGLFLGGVAIASMGLGGCMGQMAPKPSPAKVDAVAELHDSGGSPRGRAKIESIGGIDHMTVEGRDLPQGAHGLHIHAIGRCDGPDFASAGPHWNPGMKMHGRDNPMGAHRGDLPNLLIGTDGRGTVSFDLPPGSADLLDADGAAIIVHAGPDDYKTDPSGNSGARIACGVFQPR